MVLNFKYKNFQTEGYQVIKKQPAIYISSASKYSSAEYKEIISIQVNFLKLNYRLLIEKT